VRPSRHPAPGGGIDRPGITRVVDVARLADAQVVFGDLLTWGGTRDDQAGEEATVTKLHRLHDEQGQSPWLDNLTRPVPA
jgi:hypothetical protein